MWGTTLFLWSFMKIGSWLIFIFCSFLSIVISFLSIVLIFHQFYFLFFIYLLLLFHQLPFLNLPLKLFKLTILLHFCILRHQKVGWKSFIIDHFNSLGRLNRLLLSNHLWDFMITLNRLNSNILRPLTLINLVEILLNHSEWVHTPVSLYLHLQLLVKISHLWV